MQIRAFGVILTPKSMYLQMKELVVVAIVKYV